MGCLSSFLAELYTLRIPQKIETVYGMFTLYKVILKRIDLIDGDTNLKTCNIKKKNKNNGNDKVNQKLINLNCNYISSAQIYESNKCFKKYYFLNLN